MKLQLHILHVLRIISFLSAQNNSSMNSEFREMSQVRQQNELIRFTQQEKYLFIDLHNKYRGNVTPSAANMQFIEWDNNLERIAQDWADKCIWTKGNLADPSLKEKMGQNLYQGSTRNPQDSMEYWTENSELYNFKRNFCRRPNQCQSYTQIIWAETRFVGCALKIGCWKYKEIKYYVVCNYYPAGNTIGHRPYEEGASCSKCFKSDGGLCSEKLCVKSAQCVQYALQCGCNLACHNCGTLNKHKCKCQCKDGWDELDCSIPCLDYDENCGDYMCPLFKGKKNPCRKTCGFCNSVNKVKSSNICCDGKMCPYGSVLNQSCSCNILCPGPKCVEKPDINL
ncbi:cysteine-rich secretory protein 2-like [Centruroides sculpturatus]|uniref:cysteine-rich secretory protein 2-like n=1 Tax=Centruroides sculpturatus TaxID=218467 RepID=UPI000C6D37A1|nr:cysteine-rich secretory protein 2-like [Centruroides sculpturatus]